MALRKLLCHGPLTAPRAPRGLFGLRARWQALRPLTRHWLINIAIGIAIELGVHYMHPAAVENWALDRMMALHAEIDPAPPSGRTPPMQVFVNVDDATWRGKGWGGGEPDRAPRETLLKLIETAFNHGAKQVVLDILVEGDNTGRLQALQDDQEFADGLKRLLTNGQFTGDKQLVLVRSVRQPLRQLALDQGNTPIAQPYPALGEVRDSPLVDEVARNSNGRIVVAAPYFVYSSDRVLRDWRLLKVVCQRNEQGSAGALRVVPSVQLLVATRHLGVSADKMPSQEGTRCTPFPRQELVELPSVRQLTQLRAIVDRQEHEASVRYWEALRAEVQGAAGVDIGKAEFETHSLGNRVVFRSGADLRSDKYFDEVPARTLLSRDIDEKWLTSKFTGRVAVIGQSFVEAGDQHHTPMGQVAGSVVLLNAIDSMVRYPLIQEPSAWITLPLALLLIVVVGYVFARWNSAVGPLICTALALPILAILSFYFFAYGVWLDFALPLVGILMHREYKSFEERIELRKLERQMGVDHQH